MDEVIRVCNPLWEATIKEMHIDILRQEIRFILTSSYDLKDYTLEINDFKLILWVDEFREGSKDYDYYELTSINFRDVQANSDDRWLKQYPLSFNVGIEIWSTVLLLDVETIIVNGSKYDLKPAAQESDLLEEKHDHIFQKWASSLFSSKRKCDLK